MRPLSIGVISLIIACGSQGVAVGEISGAQAPGAVHWKNLCNTSSAKAGSDKSGQAKKPVASLDAARARRSCIAVPPAHLLIDSAGYFAGGLVALDAVAVGVASGTNPASP